MNCDNCSEPTSACANCPYTGVKPVTNDTDNVIERMRSLDMVEGVDYYKALYSLCESHLREKLLGEVVEAVEKTKPRGYWKISTTIELKNDVIKAIRRQIIGDAKNG